MLYKVGWKLLLCPRDININSFTAPYTVTKRPKQSHDSHQRLKQTDCGLLSFAYSMAGDLNFRPFNFDSAGWLMRTHYGRRDGSKAER